MSRRAQQTKGQRRPSWWSCWHRVLRDFCPRFSVIGCHRPSRAWLQKTSVWAEDGARGSTSTFERCSGKKTSERESFGGVIRQKTHKNLQLEIERYGEEQKQERKQVIWMERSRKRRPCKEKRELPDRKSCCKEKEGEINSKSLRIWVASSAIGYGETERGCHSFLFKRRATKMANVWRTT